jgi:hypothetical protein
MYTVRLGKRTKAKRTGIKRWDNLYLEDWNSLFKHHSIGQWHNPSLQAPSYNQMFLGSNWGEQTYCICLVLMYTVIQHTAVIHKHQESEAQEMSLMIYQGSFCLSVRIQKFDKYRKPYYSASLLYLEQRSEHRLLQQHVSIYWQTVHLTFALEELWSCTSGCPIETSTVKTVRKWERTKIILSE